MCAPSSCVLTGMWSAAPDDVGRRPAHCDSAFGVSDLMGLVWQWTNTAADVHTRAASLKGGSYYTLDAPAPNWYFPGNTFVSQHGKLLLMSPGLDRSGLIGFRCVIETPTPLNDSRVPFTSMSSSDDASRGLVVGAVLISVALLVLIGVLACYIGRRRRISRALARIR